MGEIGQSSMGNEDLSSRKPSETNLSDHLPCESIASPSSFLNFNADVKSFALAEKTKLPERDHLMD
jgi:hypothetical protein